MDEPERASRAVTRPDTVSVPVTNAPGPIRGGRPGPGRRWAGPAIAAGLVVVAGLAVWAALGRGLPAAPAAPPATILTADLYSGRENPAVPLPAAVADELYQALPGLEPTGLELTDLPDPGLGFRGFVVTPPQATRPVLRVLPGTVVVDPAGDPEILADPAGTLFGSLLRALPSDLAGEVSAELVQVRIRNASQVDLTEVTVTFPDNQTIGFGDLPAGAAGRYAAVGLAYRYALILATADGTEHRWQPIDFMGETPLPPGRYSYAISVDGDQIELRFETDDAPAATPSEAVPSPGETP